MNEKVAFLLNDQINKEFYSAYLYLDMANFYSQKGLDGFANWYEIQAREEQDHGMLIYQYLQNNGEKVTFEAIARPDKTFETFMRRRRKQKISVPHSFWTGLSKSRERKRRIPWIRLPKWNCSEMTHAACIC